MKTARETVYKALFDTVAAVADFKKQGRIVPSVNQIQPEDCPSLYMEQGAETAIFTKGIPTIWRLNVTFFVFVFASDGNPQALLNDLKDKIENALAPDNISEHEFTLGGLVSHCRIGGAPIEHWENINDDFMAAAAIPVEILTV